MDGKHLICLQSETSVFKFLRRSADGKHLIRFQSETSVFKFFRRSVEGKHLLRFQSENSVFQFHLRSVIERRSNSFALAGITEYSSSHVPGEQTVNDEQTIDFLE